MKYLIILIVMVALMGGCASDTSTLSKSEQKLQWIKDANPQQDAQLAVSKGDLRLMGLPQRAVIIPGITADEMNKYELRCGVKLIEGVSDTVLNNRHLQLMKKAHQYALQYNAIIKPHCKP
jgi:type IV pilus biogenesis protein CpaD/CtpE